MQAAVVENAPAADAARSLTIGQQVRVCCTSIIPTTIDSVEMTSRGRYAINAALLVINSSWVFTGAERARLTRLRPTSSEF